MKVLLTLTDVEPAVRLNAMLEEIGHETELASPLDDIRAMLERTRPDLLILTGGLVDSYYLQLARLQLWEGGAVVGLAERDDAELRQRLRVLGFADVLSKTLPVEDLFEGIRRVLERQRLSRETGLIGQSEPIREVLVKVEQIAPVSSTVLVEGESGTGKELVARAIHRLGPRRSRPFIAVNVGALPDTLLESELFGHEKGSFTGAAERRIGRFELAHTGTLFLDEIGDIPPSTQVKLLRVLESRELTRVGGTQVIPVDVRVVAATNRPLRDQVAEGSFRADLYYRLNVLHVYLPPLRERKDDVPLLVRTFVRDLSRQHDRPFHGISAEAMQLLQEYAWPGNVRELRNLIESMVVLAPGREIQAADIPSAIREGGEGVRLLPVRISRVEQEAVVGALGGRELEFILRNLVELKLQVEELRRRLDEERLRRAEWASEVHVPVSGVHGLEAGLESAMSGGIGPSDVPMPSNAIVLKAGMPMADIERAAIEATLRETRGNRRRAAELLGIGERTLYRKLREYQPELADEESA